MACFALGVSASGGRGINVDDAVIGKRSSENCSGFAMGWVGMENTNFDDQLRGVMGLTESATEAELAGYFGCRQSAVTDARRRSAIPLYWLALLLQAQCVNPEWVLTGQGAQSISGGCNEYETEDESLARAAFDICLARLPSRALAEELLRRIQASQAACCARGVLQR